MSLDDFYIRNIEYKKRGNINIYNKIIDEVFGKRLSWNEFKNTERDKQREVMILLEDRIKIKESPIDIKKMSRAIQDSRSGVGGSAMTEFTCNFCEEKELWGNTSVPNICRDCATNMATKIAKYYHDILKD